MFCYDFWIIEMSNKIICIKMLCNGIYSIEKYDKYCKLCYFII